MKYKMKKLIAGILAFSLAFALFAPVTRAKAQIEEEQIAEAVEYVVDAGEGEAESAMEPTETQSECISISLDETYPEADEKGNVYSKVIPAEVLVAFDGPVAITLDYVTGDYQSWDSLLYYTETTEGVVLSQKGNLVVYTGTGSFTIVLEESELAKAIEGGGIRFRLGKLHFTKAELRSATPDDYYTGDGGTGHMFQRTEMEKLTGDVVLTLKYRTLSQGYDEYFIRLMGNWQELSWNDYVDAAFVNGNGVRIDGSKTEASVTIKEEAIQRVLRGAGYLNVQVYGIIVEEATLQSASEVNKPLAEGNLTVRDNNYVCIEHSVPDDGKVYLQTYEIYDEEGVFAGTWEFRGGSGVSGANWVNGSTETIYADEIWGENAYNLIPEIGLWRWMSYFSEWAPVAYQEYTYKLISQKEVTEMLPMPTFAVWDRTQTPGWIVWEPVEGATGYKVTMISDKRVRTSWECGASQSGVYVADYITDSGSYRFEIVARGTKDVMDSGRMAVPSGYQYIRPEEKVSSPEKVWWSVQEGTDIPSVANWTPVAGARGYRIIFYAYDTENPGWPVGQNSMLVYCSEEEQIPTEAICPSWWLDSMMNQAEWQGKTFIYRFGVSSYSGNIEFWTHSGTETLSDEYKSLELLNQELKESIATKGLERVLATVGAENVADAMTYSAEVRSEVAQAEALYAAEHNVSVSAPVSTHPEIAEDTMNVEGAGLNVESGSIGLVMKEAESKIMVNRKLYHNVVQADISLAAGNSMVSEWKVPVAITMAVPGNIAPERLVVLHENNGTTEMIYPMVNADGTVTFAVTENGTYAFAGITLYTANGMEYVGNAGDFGDELNVELSTLPEGSFAVTPDLAYSAGYGFTKKALGNGALAVSFDGRYAEIMFKLPKEIDLSKYDKMVITLETASEELKDAVGLKVTAADARQDANGNPDPLKIEWEVVKCPGGDVVIDLSEYPDKNVERIGILANSGACDVDVYRIAFLPRDSTTPNEPDAPEQPEVEFGELPEGSKVFLPTETNMTGYGYTTEELDNGALAVSFTGQYQEIQFNLLEEIDLSECDRMVMTIETASASKSDSVALKVIATDAELDEWNCPIPLKWEWGVVQYPGGDYELDLSEFADKKVCRVCIVADSGANDVNVYRIAFLPKEDKPSETPDVELSTLPEGSKVILPTETTMTGYGYSKKNLGNGAVAVSISGQYQEIQFNLPEEVDLSLYDEMVLTLESGSAESNEAVVLKVIATDAEIDPWNSPVPIATQWGVVQYPVGDVTIDLSDFADKKVNRISIRANLGACDVNVYRIAFLPKEGTTPDGPDTPNVPDTPAPSDTVEAFVARIYRTMLEREPDAASQDWINKLTTGTYTGAQLVEEFFGSAEFERKNNKLSNERFVQIMYRTLFNREADPNGLAVWMGYLEEGYIRRFVLAGLANSAEFQNLCNGFGIAPGTVQLTWAESTPNLSEREFNVWQFVERLYVEVLGRYPDQVGMQDWVNKLLREGWTGAAAAEGFIMSPEFLNKDMTSEQFVQTMYRVFFDRDADPTGLSHWTGLMAQGHGKRFVFAGCANSGEFRNVCDSFGITRGDIILTTAECTPGLTDQEIKVWDFVERLYVEVLGRPADSIGLEDWARKLLSKEWSGAEVAEGFILSPEFLGKTMDDEPFIRIMYKAFFGREADADGLRNLTNAMAQGSTKQDVFAFFATSEEFGNLCRSYGIDQ